MAEEIKTPMSDFDKVTEVKDTAEIILLQDGANARVEAPVFEQKIINKTSDRMQSQYIKKDYLLNIGGELFDKTTIKGKYIDRQSGNLSNEPKAEVTNIMYFPEGSEFIEIKGRNSNSNGVRFIDKNSVQIKPIDENGNQLANYGAGELNGRYNIPLGAIGVQVTISFTSGNANNLSILLNGIKGSDVKIKETFLPKKEDIKTDDLKVTIDNQRIILERFQLKETFLDRSKVTDTNSSFQFEQIFENNILIKSAGDDIAPLRINGSAIGGNHGWDLYRRVRQTNHDKTTADVGSLWRNADGKDFLLCKIHDANNIDFIPFDGYYRNTITRLTLVSNGAHNTPIVAENVEIIINPYNFTLSKNFVMTMDGNIIKNNGIYEGNLFRAVESYDIIDLRDCAVKLYNGRPSGGYTVQPEFNKIGADSLLRISNSYDFKRTDLQINQDVTIFKKCMGEYGSGYQSAKLDIDSEICIPNTLPINGVNYGVYTDFISGVTINVTKEFWKDKNNAPNRILQRTPRFYYNIGYINNRTSDVSNAIFIHTNKKIYPRFFSNDTPKELNAGDVLKCSMYRNFDFDINYDYTVNANENAKESLITVDINRNNVDSVSFANLRSQDIGMINVKGNNGDFIEKRY